MSEINFMTVKKLYDICKLIVEDGKGQYKIYLSTGGYYDGEAMNYHDIDETDTTLTLYTPSVSLKRENYELR